MATLRVTDTFGDVHDHPLVDGEFVEFDADKCLHFTDANGKNWWYLARTIRWFVLIDGDPTLNPFPEAK